MASAVALTDHDSNSSSSAGMAASAASLTTNAFDLSMKPSDRMDTLPSMVDAHALLECHRSETHKFSVGRTVLLLGEDCVGKHLLIETIYSLQELSRSLQPNSEALDSDQLNLHAERYLETRRQHAAAASSEMASDEATPQHRHRRHHTLSETQRSILVRGAVCTGVNDTDEKRTQLLSSKRPELSRKPPDEGSIRPRICSLELRFVAQNTQRFSVATLLQNNDFTCLTNEFDQWHNVTFFVVMFSLYDVGSFLAASKWIDFVTALLSAKSQYHTTQRMLRTDGACRAWLVGTYRSTDIAVTAPNDERIRTTRHVHTELASALARRRNMRYREINVHSLVDAERLCDEMFNYAGELTVHNHHQRQKAQARPLGESTSAPAAITTTTTATATDGGYSLRWLLPTWLCSPAATAATAPPAAPSMSAIQALRLDDSDFSK